MSPDRKAILPLFVAALAVAACTDSEPLTVCESSGTNYTTKAAITKTARDERREEVIKLGPNFLNSGVGIVTSPDGQCGISMTEFYSDPTGEIVVNGNIQARGSERIRPWHTTISPTFLNSSNPITLNLTTQDGKVFFYRPGLSGWKVEVGEPQLPSDVVSEQSLQQSNIRVYQGRETQLYLRGNIFDIPLFKDASDGKVGKVSVVLIDAGRLYPEKINDLPKELAGHYHIYEKVTQEKQELLAETLDAVLQLTQENEEKYIEGKINQEKYEGSKKYYEKRIEEIKNEIQQNSIPPRGLFMNGRDVQRYRPDLLGNYPESADGITIYLAVGDKMKPHPTQSNPKPNQFPQVETDLFELMLSNKYLVKLDSVTPGYVAHHEASHYETSSEPSADKKALERIGRSLYPFVFVNSNGLTYTLDWKDWTANNEALKAS